MWKENRYVPVFKISSITSSLWKQMGNRPSVLKFVTRKLIVFITFTRVDLYSHQNLLSISFTSPLKMMHNPDSKVPGANMGPIWGRQDRGGPHVGPMNFAIWELTYMVSCPLGWLRYSLVRICVFFSPILIILGLISTRFRFNVLGSWYRLESPKLTSWMSF